MSKIRSKINFHILPVPPRLVPDIHNDGLEVLGVPDDLIQEAHAQGPRPDDQVICCQLCHCVLSLSASLRFEYELTLSIVTE